MTRTGAIAAGLALFALPFFQSGFGDGHAGAAHMDHVPHHGGSLVMLGDHHLELVRSAGQVELYVSDSERRPLVPRAASVAFDGGERRMLAWSGYRSVAHAPERFEWADYRIDVGSGPPLAIRLPNAPFGMPQ